MEREYHHEFVKRGPWSEEEDKLLRSYIEENGISKWTSLPKEAGLRRCGKSCRLRWLNYLRPGIKRGNFSREESNLIIALHAMHGNRWSRIAAELPGRTDNEIKNHWNTRLKKQLVHRGHVLNPMTPGEFPENMNAVMTTSEYNLSSSMNMMMAQPHSSIQQAELIAQGALLNTNITGVDINTMIVNTAIYSPLILPNIDLTHDDPQTCSRDHGSNDVISINPAHNPLLLETAAPSSLQDVPENAYDGYAMAALGPNFIYSHGDCFL